MNAIISTAQRIGQLLSAALVGDESAATAKKTEDRSLVRSRVKVRVKVHWREPDGQKSISARTVEMSEYGASIECAKAIEPGTAAWVDFEGLRLTGGAKVRHCTRLGSKYRIGLRFSGPLVRPL